MTAYAEAGVPARQPLYYFGTRDRHEAAYLVAGAQGLRPPVLLGHYTARYAINLIDRLFPRDPHPG